MARVAKGKAVKSVKADTQTVRNFSTDGTVRVALGATLNKGNYESARVDIAISLPFDANTPGSQERAYEEARTWVENKMTLEMQSLGKSGQ
jgi:hypothetical protein